MGFAPRYTDFGVIVYYLRAFCVRTRPYG